MKLCTYDTGNGPRAGVIVAERVVDVATLLGEQGGLRDIRALLDLPNDPLTPLQSAVGSPSATQGVPLPCVLLRAPTLQPPTGRYFMANEGIVNAEGTRHRSDAWYRRPRACPLHPESQRCAVDGQQRRPDVPHLGRHD